MRIEKDFKELLRLFNKHKVRYCVIGAYAVAFYARPRYTKDIDILVEPDAGNGEKIVKALNEFGFKSLKLSAKDFNKKGRAIQLGYEPVRADIVTSIDGCDFEKVWKNRKIGFYGNIKIFFIGLNELIKNKKITKRGQDLLDLDILLAAKRSKRKT